MLSRFLEVGWSGVLSGLRGDEVLGVFAALSGLSALSALEALDVLIGRDVPVALSADMPSRRAWGFCNSLGFGWALTIGSGAFGILGARMAFCLRFFMRLLFGFDGPPLVYLWFLMLPLIARL